MALLEVNNLNVRFPTEDGVVHAVRDVSFTVDRGEVLGVVGESGSGKSVTNLAMMGLLPRSTRIDGSIKYNGDELVGLPRKRQTKYRGNELGMIFQDPMTSLNPVYTIGWQITEAVRAHQDVPKKEAAARAVELLELVGIPQAARRVHSYPHEFSGGMRQRVMIAMSMANNPQVLIADEPTTALDVTVQAQILETLVDIQQRTNIAIILITHDLPPTHALHHRPAGRDSERGQRRPEAAPDQGCHAVAHSDEAWLRVCGSMPAGFRSMPEGDAGARASRRGRPLGCMSPA
jgi:peptide/nickel transport system ATP-binding protein